jgi:hypothetical protein
MAVPDPNASDWSELDLLTVSEAVGRLDTEIADLRGRLEHMAEGAERDAMEQRLVLLGRARDNMNTTPPIRRQPEPG